MEYESDFSDEDSGQLDLYIYITINYTCHVKDVRTVNQNINNKELILLINI